MTRIFKFTSSMIFCCILHTAITFAEPQTPNENSIKSGLTKPIQSILVTPAPVIPEEVKESIRFRVDHGYNVGIVVGIVSPNGTEYFSYGKTAISSGQTVNENTIFEIGSITKVFTALLLADMVEKGELSFHDPLEKYLPNSVRVPKRKNQSIKLLHLVMQSAGLPYLPDNIDLTTNPDNPLASYTVEQMYDFLSNCKLKYDIGTQCEYSNYGHALLGHILSLKSDTTYEDLVKQRITFELGMTDTAIKLTVGMQKQLARGHTGIIELPDFELAATFSGSGGLRSTARDMVRFLEACLGLKSTRLQPAFNTVYGLLKEPPGTYEKPVGSVWSLITNGNQTIRWFEGITLGQHSFIGFTKEGQRGVVVLSNNREEIKDIGFHLLNADSPLLDWPVPIKVSAKTLANYTGTYQLGSEEINILLQNGHLVLFKKWNQVPLKCMLYARSDSEFWNPTFDIKVMFQRDAKDEVIGLLFHEHGRDDGQEAKKITGEPPRTGDPNAQEVDAWLTKAHEPVVYNVSDGRIEIKPRLKNELIISLHILKFAEDHHQLFIPWAQQMRKDLSEKTLQDATTLIENSHEWQLCFLVQDYDGQDTIEGLVEFVKNLKTVRWQNEDVPIDSWVSTNQLLINALGLTPEQFPLWYANFLQRYYYQAFEKQWLSEHKQLVYEDAKLLATELESLEFSPTAFMEKLTGRMFTGSTKIILYPSSFSRPQHAYGFNEKGHKVAVYKIGGGRHGAIATIFHELLHPLIADWWEAERMKQPISKLANESLFKAAWEKMGKHSYSYPERWLDELIVHAVSVYMEYKEGLISEEAARRQSYGSYENALYGAIFDRYDTFDCIDDFIFYAITRIKVSGKGPDAHFAYIKDSGQPERSQIERTEK